MAPLQVLINSREDSNDTEWSVPDHAGFVTRVCAIADDRRAQHPFVEPHVFSDDDAIASGIPQLTGRSGAFIWFDDGSMRFVEAPAGKIIVSGSGRVDDDTLDNRVDVCRQWLETRDRCYVVITMQEAPSDAAVARWRQAEDAQEAALAAAAADSSPENMRALADAVNARHLAYRELPPWPSGI
ncbi:hypothetical protein [Demequina sp.]|uniref:hypothetical protein n=1 Tax=Demequina sp. TaxID=2050685 RepID=UPI003D0D98C7